MEQEVREAPIWALRRPSPASQPAGVASLQAEILLRESDKSTFSEHERSCEISAVIAAGQPTETLRVTSPGGFPAGVACRLTGAQLDRDVRQFFDDLESVDKSGNDRWHSQTPRR
jgi:hypothetical protein